MDGFADDGMGFPEGQAFLGQVVGHIRRIGKVAFQDFPHVLAIDGHLVDHGGIDGQGELQIIDGIEDAFFIFLHVLVVGHGDALHHSQDTHEMAVEPACLAADEFADVGILLLGHDGRARAVGIVEFDELKFRRRPKNKFFGQTAQVHHGHGCKFEERNDIVSIADGI